MPRRLSFARDDPGGADLCEAEFGVGVDIATDIDQGGFDALDDVVYGCGGIVGEGHGVISTCDWWD